MQTLLGTSIVSNNFTMTDLELAKQYTLYHDNVAFRTFLIGSRPDHSGLLQLMLSSDPETRARIAAWKPPTHPGKYKAVWHWPALGASVRSLRSDSIELPHHDWPLSDTVATMGEFTPYLSGLFKNRDDHDEYKQVIVRDSARISVIYTNVKNPQYYVKYRFALVNGVAELTERLHDHFGGKSFDRYADGYRIYSISNASETYYANDVIVAMFTAGTTTFALIAGVAHIIDQLSCHKPYCVKINGRKYRFDVLKCTWICIKITQE